MEIAEKAGQQKTLEQEIADLVKAMGVDLVGFTDTARLEKAPPSGNLKSVLPNAESAIGLAVAFDEDAVYKFMRKEDYWALNRSYQEGYRILTRAGQAIKVLLEKRGYDVFLPMVNFQYEDGQAEPQSTMRPVISHKYVCEAAGIGWHGWSGNLLTSEFGANVSLNCVVTSAKLAPSPIVVEDWCSTCRICTAVCPTHYMPKQEADEVEIAGHTARYAKRRTALRCSITCGGANCKRRDDSRWSAWSAEFIEDMPNAHDSDEAFEERVKEAVVEQPENIRLRLIYEQAGLNLVPQDQIDSMIDTALLNCSFCQLVCVPGMDKRQEAYRMIISSGHVLEHDPRMLVPADMPAAGEYIKIVEGAAREDAEKKVS